jgi:Mg2+ and Co2+ transporter CorA
MWTPMNSDYVLQDLDKEATYRSALSKIASAESNNFAVYFDHDQALAATDLKHNGLDKWIQDHESKPGTKWVHFWADQTQRPLIEAFASRYDISPRLIGLLCPQTSVSLPPKQPSSAQMLNGHLCSPSPRHRVTNDVESMAGTVEMGAPQSSMSGPKDITFGDVVNDLWHFHSVDWGQKYVHVGVNVLSVIPGLEHSVDKPAGQRLWTSIVLCHDGTVISTLERRPNSDNVKVAQTVNKMTKRHVLNIFARISRLVPTSTGGSSDLMNVRIRPDTRLSDNSSESANKERTDCASLLFYYLFDDWMSTYALIARREHPYRDSLEKVRQDLTKAPDVHVLETLHDIGRQLTVLRLIYQSYATVVTRLLTRYQRMLPAAAARSWQQAADGMQSDYGMNSNQNAFVSPRESSLAQRPDLFFHDSTDLLTFATHPNISSPALSRFERLLDRIHLYALSEINHCIAEKESLSFMTFNLLTLSESHSVEKLTRTTIFLAKATVIFLPVSLLTAYFSIQVGNIDQIYSLKTYWLSFSVVAAASIVFLAASEAATGTIEGQIVFRSLHRALWRKGVAKVMRRKMEGR